MTDEEQEPNLHESEKSDPDPHKVKRIIHFRLKSDADP
jgi:hypothetical protein